MLHYGADLITVQPHRIYGSSEVAASLRAG